MAGGQQPVSLPRTTSLDYVYEHTPNVLFICCSIFLIVYGVLARSWSGQPVDRTAGYGFLFQPSQLAPSIFSLIFTAAAARNVRIFALWRLERGGHLGALDQLFGNTPVLSAISSQFLLRAINPLAVGLLVLWALSPVGGQASLRIIGVKINHCMCREIYNMSFKTTVSTAAIVSPETVKKSPMDLWASFKIPRVETWIEAGRKSDDDGGWYDLENSYIDYTSRIGVPISGISQDTAKGYWIAKCPTMKSEKGYNKSDDAWFGPTWDDNGGSNIRIKAGRTPKMEANDLVYGSKIMNLLLDEPLNRDLTFGTLRIFAPFSAKFAFSSPTQVSNTEYYLLDPDSPRGDLDNTPWTKDSLDIPKQFFEIRLSQLLNILWISMIADYLPVSQGLSVNDFQNQMGNKTAQI
ncbi:hypothetical protein K469DRAFT_745678 [Zopfia rhizophila CBS 207.26]|uniref:Uncharacterized protein n=1 Tax=Zopfia rhizophila CBS 207.26 TaxID=1314779 RepID=A0A6A6EMJ4_9PEZI|nr:hypothetical protein K469DRAFT_745678 [Zopfia rhizophila CBS 207.26]